MKAYKALTLQANELRSAWSAKVAERDRAIQDAIKSGETMYRIAKETGLTETAVRKIRDK